MKKIFVLCICIAVLAIVFVFSGKGKYTKVLQDLEETTIVVASLDITIGGKNYKCKDDYCEQIRNLYEQYQINKTS